MLFKIKIIIYRMKVLQLFSTSESVDTVIRQMGFKVFDHLDRDFSDWEPGQFDIIWASIPKINNIITICIGCSR